MKSKIWNPSDFSQATADWKSDTGTVISITSPAFETRITFSEIEIIFYPFYDLSLFLYTITIGEGGDILALFDGVSEYLLSFCYKGRGGVLTNFLDFCV